MNYTVLFWIGTIFFLTSSMLLAWQQGKCVGGLFFIQVASGIAMFVGSKIGRSFLGLE